MLSQAIGELLPLAVGVALSPIPIIAVILMLATPKARSNGPAFALGWIVGLVAVSVIVLVVAGGADDPSSTASDSVNWVRLLLGLAFVSMALKQWRKRPKKGETATMPKWMDDDRQVHPVRSFAHRAAALRHQPEEPRAHARGGRIDRAGRPVDDRRAPSRSRCS